MPSFKQVILVGHITRDLELQYLPNQTPVVTFGIATNHKYKGSDGQQCEDACFIDCTCFGKSAESLKVVTV